LEGTGVEKAFEYVLNEIYKLTIRHVLDKRSSVSVGPSRKLNLKEPVNNVVTKDETCCV
jgi:hypothetical protein